MTSDAPVLVTGASGYIASWLVHALLAAGRTVHATVRAKDGPRVAHLQRMAQRAPGALRLFEADLLVPGSFAAAARDCGVVFHTASPFAITGFADAERDIIRPAVEGTRNVLEAVDQTSSVRRVVLTSSVAAICGDSCDASVLADGTFREEHWNATSSPKHNPYHYSKRTAELEAWKIASAQQRWDLVAVNAGLVFGPSLTKYSKSYSIDLLLSMVNGRYRRGVPRLHHACVDVRDVVMAHVRAAERRDAHGRYIVSAGELWMIEMVDIIRERFSSHALRLPRRESAKPLVWLLGPLVAGITRGFVQKNVGYAVHFDSSRSVRELGMQYRPLADSIAEQVQQLIDDGLVTSSSTQRMSA